MLLILEVDLFFQCRGCSWNWI